MSNDTVTGLDDSLTFPPSEVSYSVKYLQSTYASLQLYLVALGIQVFTSIYGLSIFRETARGVRKERLPYVALSFVILALCTMAIVTESVYLANGLINNKEAEGSIVLVKYYVQDHRNKWYSVFTTVANVFVSFLGNALLLYRCYLLYRRALWVLSPPILTYIASIAMSFVVFHQQANPPSNYSTQLAFSTAWFSLTVAVSVMTTFLIVYRLIQLRQKASEGTPSTEHLRAHTGVVAIVVESAVLLSFLGILASVLYSPSITTPVAPALNSIWLAFNALSPQFIIFRIATGKSWTKNVEQAPATRPPAKPMAFNIGRRNQTQRSSSEYTTGYVPQMSQRIPKNQ